MSIRSSHSPPCCTIMYYQYSTELTNQALALKVVLTSLSRPTSSHNKVLSHGKGSLAGASQPSETNRMQDSDKAAQLDTEAKYKHTPNQIKATFYLLMQ